jgi:type VI protein secretion system component VasF
MARVAPVGGDFVSDRERKAERIFLDVVFLGAAVVAVLVFGGTMLVLVWLFVAWLGAT